MLFERSNFTLLCLRDTPVAVIGRQASEQHRLGGLFPEEPCPGQVVEQATHSGQLRGVSALLLRLEGPGRRRDATRNQYLLPRGTG